MPRLFKCLLKKQKTIYPPAHPTCVYNTRNIANIFFTIENGTVDYTTLSATGFFFLLFKGSGRYNTVKKKTLLPNAILFIEYILFYLFNITLINVSIVHLFAEKEVICKLSYICIILFYFNQFVIELKFIRPPACKLLYEIIEWKNGIYFMCEVHYSYMQYSFRKK